MKTPSLTPNSELSESDSGPEDDHQLKFGLQEASASGTGRVSDNSDTGHATPAGNSGVFGASGHSISDPLFFGIDYNL